MSEVSSQPQPLDNPNTDIGVLGHLMHGGHGLVFSGHGGGVRGEYHLSFDFLPLSQQNVYVQKKLYKIIVKKGFKFTL